MNPLWDFAKEKSLVSYFDEAYVGFRCRSQITAFKEGHESLEGDAPGEMRRFQDWVAAG